MLNEYVNISSNSDLNYIYKNFINDYASRIDSSIELDISSALVHIAPMLKVTDRHFRRFMRLLTTKAVVWTEMIADNTIIHNKDSDRFLAYSSEEHPIVCQLGGNNPANLFNASCLVRSYGYDGINLNIGCPSSKVSIKGCFGAQMMNNPSLVNKCLISCSEGFQNECSIKTRIGINNNDNIDWLHNVLRQIHVGLVNTNIILHCRKAILGNIKTIKNCTVPALNYKAAVEIADRMSNVNFIVNGGIYSIKQILDILHIMNNDKTKPLFSGVMIGRCARDNPCTLANIDKLIYKGVNPATSKCRYNILTGYIDYLESIQNEFDNFETRVSWNYIRCLISLFNYTSASTYYKGLFNNLVQDQSLKYNPIHIIDKLIDSLSDNYNSTLFADLWEQDMLVFN